MTPAPLVFAKQTPRKPATLELKAKTKYAVIERRDGEIWYTCIVEREENEVVNDLKANQIIHWRLLDFSFPDFNFPTVTTLVNKENMLVIYGEFESKVEAIDCFNATIESINELILGDPLTRMVFLPRASDTKIIKNLPI